MVKNLNPQRKKWEIVVHNNEMGVKKNFLPLKFKLLTQSVFVCFQFFWALGSTFMVVVALIVMPTLGWRWMTAFATVPVIIFIILCRVSKCFEKFQMLYFTFYSLKQLRLLSQFISVYPRFHYRYSFLRAIYSLQICYYYMKTLIYSNFKLHVLV